MESASGNYTLTKSDLRLARMFKALGNPLRYQIMQYLADHPVCITGDIVEFVNLAQSTVSQHLKVLREAGLISGEIEGPATCYCISSDGVKFLKDQIEGWLPTCCVEILSTGKENEAGNCTAYSAAQPE